MSYYKPIPHEDYEPLHNCGDEAIKSCSDVYDVNSGQAMAAWNRRAQDKTEGVIASSSAPCSATTETHWACACVKRDRAGKLKSIKLHPRTTKACRVCGAKQSGREDKGLHAPTVNRGDGHREIAAYSRSESPNAPHEPRRPGE